MKKIAAAICVSLLFAMQATAQEKAGKKEIEKIIEEYILAHPEVIERSMREYYERMKRNAQENEFKNALQDRRRVELGGSPMLGEKSAPIVIAEFSDFQCPYCAKSFETISNLRLKYGGRVSVVFKHFPLEVHNAARAAARASVAAEKQGKFWEYHDVLMSRQGEWSRARDVAGMFLDYAVKLGMDQERFRKDMEDENADSVIDRDIKQGTSLQVNTTPTYFVNGIPIRGTPDIAYFSRVIDYLLKEKR